MSTFRAAAIQMRVGNDINANVEALSQLVAEAANKGAHYVQTPEATGGFQRDRKVLLATIREEADDLVFLAAAKLAKQYGIYLHIGSTAIRASDDKAANRGVIFAPSGEKITTYDKIHMFDVDLDNGESWRESNTYQGGDKAVVVETSLTTIGMGICYDIRFPQLYQAQALLGAHVLTAPAAFTRQTGEAHWHIFHRARAIENGAFMISAAQGGFHQDGRGTYGHSIIVSPWGTILAEADHDEPCVIVADIDVNLSVLARKKIPNLANARKFTAQIVKA